jgi:hypothetical protein
VLVATAPNPPPPPGGDPEPHASRLPCHLPVWRRCRLFAALFKDRVHPSAVGRLMMVRRAPGFAAACLCQHAAAPRAAAAGAGGGRGAVLDRQPGPSEALLRSQPARLLLLLLLPATHSPA